jgi:hypothetical protein
MTPAPEKVEMPGAEAMLYRDAPSWEGMKSAAIGRIRFDSVVAGNRLLYDVAERMKAEGFGALLGPMDGDTWHSYRLVSESDGSAPFLMEPTSGPHDLAAFTTAGFEPVSRYVSARALLRNTITEEPVGMPGITVANWDGKDAEGLIQKLFAMSGTAFRNNRFFKPIDLESFLDLYRPIMPFVDPQHVFFARQGEQLVGFLFGMPDRLARDGKPAAILKTYASALRGVGHLLADTYHRRAIEMGFTDVIHALMHEDNVSRGSSEKHKATIFRRYALMALKL